MQCGINNYYFIQDYHVSDTNAFVTTRLDNINVYPLIIIIVTTIINILSWSLFGVQAKRSERYGGDGLVWKRRAAGRVDQEGKPTRRRDSETQNGRRQVLRTVQ